MTRKLVVITGTSSGVGQALANKFLTDGFNVIGISRSSNLKLKTNANFHEILFDLADILDYNTLYNAINSKLDFNELNEFLLINNAGSLGEVNQLTNMSDESIIKTIQLNTISPILLAKYFMNHLQECDIHKVIFNISSGAAVQPYSGWSVYCSSKSSLDMFTRTISIEQKNKRYPFKTIAIYPGKVDTKMQQTIRLCSAVAFPKVENFKAFYNSKQLNTPEFVAVQIYEHYLKSKEVELPEIIRIPNQN